MLSCRPVAVNDPVRSVELVRVDGERRETLSDRVAVERPLEVRLSGEPFSVIMRTPGDDRHLAIGFLFSEGIVRTALDVESFHGVEGSDVIDVRLSSDRVHILAEVLGTRRNVTMNSSCGMCGRRTLESLDVPGAPLETRWTIPAAVVTSLPGQLARGQQAFAETGGLHAAALVFPDGRVERTAEDVGRHNAVDKLVGLMVMTGRLPLDAHVLAVSGRLSFEIVQKAWLAGVPMVVAVSAPSSLSIELAERAGMTIVGFTRGGRFNIYTGAQRVT
jgi:FdhD protein